MAKPRQEPANERLWQQVVAAAKQKFRVYPSMAASKWAHNEYIRRGGRFVASRAKDKEARKGKESASAKAQEAKEKRQADREKRARGEKK